MTSALRGVGNEGASPRAVALWYAALESHGDGEEPWPHVWE